MRASVQSAVFDLIVVCVLLSTWAIDGVKYINCRCSDYSPRIPVAWHDGESERQDAIWVVALWIRECGTSQYNQRLPPHRVLQDANYEWHRLTKRVFSTAAQVVLKCSPAPYALAGPTKCLDVLWFAGRCGVCMDVRVYVCAFAAVRLWARRPAHFACYRGCFHQDPAYAAQVSGVL